MNLVGVNREGGREGSSGTFDTGPSEIGTTSLYKGQYC